MLIDHLNLNHFRIFEVVYRTKSMTAAAKELHMTQSGVSQHMKSLEGMLNVKLFDRIKQRLLPTSEATQLYRAFSRGLNEMEQALVELKGGTAEVAGTISVGMPLEFGQNVGLPSLAKFAAKYPKTRFRFVLGLASSVTAMLLDGSLDFAFVDDIKLERRIVTQKVYDEILELCASQEYLKSAGVAKNTKAYFETLDYIEYLEGEPILRNWFGHHLSNRGLELNVRAYVADTKGVGRLIGSGLGVGVLPSHVLEKFEKEGIKFHRFKGSGTPLKNSISLAWLEGRTLSSAAQAAMKELPGIMKAQA